MILLQEHSEVKRLCFNKIIKNNSDMITYKIQTNASGTRNMTICDAHLDTIM